MKFLVFREDAEGRKNPEPTCIAWLELEKGRSAEEPLKEIFAEYKVFSERTLGKNRGPASDLSGISELRTGLKGLAHASDQSWQMVGTALSCQTVVDSVVGATPKASLKRNADGSQAASVLKHQSSTFRKAWHCALRRWSSAQSQGGKASSHQQMEVEHIRDDDDDIAFGESVSTAGGIPRGVAMDRHGSAAMSQVSVPSVISNIQANMVNIAAVLARFTCNVSVLQWPAGLVEDHLEHGHWPQGLPTGTELSVNHLLLGWDVRFEDYDQQPRLLDSRLGKD